MNEWLTDGLLQSLHMYEKHTVPLLFLFLVQQNTLPHTAR